jgi:DNA (cytosine-5)-methyltransferase 1
MDVIGSALEELGYAWAYRVVDSRAFGLPQRRRRVYLVASLEADPRTVLFADEEDPPDGVNERTLGAGLACGFYWTEGIRGLGWASDAVPTLKGGSTIGIPSSPAILLPDGMVVTPDIRDAERLQGFPADWTKPAEDVAKRGSRWKLVGNAVSVPVAEWIGKRLARPGSVREYELKRLHSDRTWPTAAWNVGSGRCEVVASEWPVRRTYTPLAEFLRHPVQPLSARATAGFLGRAERGSLRFPKGFLPALQRHLERAGGAPTRRSIAV